MTNWLQTRLPIWAETHEKVSEEHVILAIKFESYRFERIKLWGMVAHWLAQCLVFGFESHSSRHVGTFDKSITHS